jgi:hypothetical protein
MLGIAGELNGRAQRGGADDFAVKVLRECRWVSQAY